MRRNIFGFICFFISLFAITTNAQLPVFLDWEFTSSIEGNPLNISKVLSAGQFLSPVQGHRNAALFTVESDKQTWEEYFAGRYIIGVDRYGIFFQHGWFHVDASAPEHISNPLQLPNGAFAYVEHAYGNSGLLIAFEQNGDALWTSPIYRAPSFADRHGLINFGGGLCTYIRQRREPWPFTFISMDGSYTRVIPQEVTLNLMEMVALSQSTLLMHGKDTLNSDWYFRTIDTTGTILHEEVTSDSEFTAIQHKGFVYSLSPASDPDHPENVNTMIKMQKWDSTGTVIDEVAIWIGEYYLDRAILVTSRDIVCIFLSRYNMVQVMPIFLTTDLERIESAYFLANGTYFADESGGLICATKSRKEIIFRRYSTSDVPGADYPPIPDIIDVKVYPNPFNATTNLKYDLRTATNVSLRIYDITGRQVATLIDEFRQAGSYTIAFDASALPSGVYLYRFDVQDFFHTGKLLLIK